MATINITIEKNDGQMDESFCNAVNTITNDIKEQLKQNGYAMVYANKWWRAGDKFTVVGKAFKEAGYYCCLNYIPNVLQSLMVSKTPIGPASGCMVTRQYI